MLQPGARKPFVLLVSILASTLTAPCSVSADALFVRGDVNSDGQVGLADATAGLDLLFFGQEIPCTASADANDDESVDVSDSVYILLYLFLGRAEPPPPLSECGVDPTPGELECETFPACGPDEPPPDGPGLTGDIFRLRIEEAPEVTYAERIEATAPLGHDPYVEAAYDIPQATTRKTPITFKESSTAGGPHQQVMRLEFTGQEPGIYPLDGNQATAFYLGEVGTFGSDDGTLATGEIVVERFDAERITGTFDFELCDISELAAGHCDAGSMKFTGSFDVGRPPDVIGGPLPDLVIRVQRVRANLERDGLNIDVGITNSGTGPLMDFPVVFGALWFFKGAPPEDLGPPVIEGKLLEFNDLRVGQSVTKPVFVPAWRFPDDVPFEGPGSMVIAVDFDERVGELNEGNNKSPIFSWDERQPDLKAVIHEIEVVDPGPGGALSTFFVKYEIQNIGSAAVAPTWNGIPVAPEVAICLDWQEELVVPCRSLRVERGPWPAFRAGSAFVHVAGGRAALPASGVATIKIQGVDIQERRLDNNTSAPLAWTARDAIVWDFDWPRVNLDEKGEFRGAVIPKNNGAGLTIETFAPGETYKISVTGRRGPTRFQVFERAGENPTGVLLTTCVNDTHYQRYGTVSSQIGKRLACPFTATKGTHYVFVTTSDPDAFQVEIMPDRSTDVAVTVEEVTGGDEPTLTYTLHNLGERPTGDRTFHVDLWMHRHAEDEWPDLPINDAQREPDDCDTFRAAIPAGGTLRRTVEITVSGRLEYFPGGMAVARVGDDSDWPDPDRTNNTSPRFRWGELPHFKIQILDLKRPTTEGGTGTVSFMVHNFAEYPPESPFFSTDDWCLDIHQFHFWPDQGEWDLTETLPNYPWNTVCGPLPPGKTIIVFDAPGITFFDGNDKVYLGVGIYSDYPERTLFDNSSSGFRWPSFGAGAGEDN